MTSDPLLDSADLVVVGAGIVGLAHAYHAMRRGLSVAVVERDRHAVGASVRNFGHGCITAQTGSSLEYGLAAREHWLALAGEAGFRVWDKGTLVAARAEDEYAVLAELAQQRGPGHVRLLGREDVGRFASLGSDVLGGALFPLDIRLDQREAVAAIARLLAARGVRFHWSTSAHSAESGEVATSRGRIRADGVVLAVGHDIDRHFPDVARSRDVRRCSLRMLRVRDPHRRAIGPAVLTGLSMLRYGAFAACPSLPRVRDRLERERADLVEVGLNLMFTQLPDGDLTIGDTHSYDHTVEPFGDELPDSLVLEEAAHLLGVPELVVRQRWTGVYASAPDPFLVEAPHPGVRVVSVTSGIGMTTALGLAPEVLDDLLT